MEDMLSGLTGQGKMSKSDPNSAIYMEDEEVFLLQILCIVLFMQ
jgi:tryptophanyl-tRNA synthetase